MSLEAIERVTETERRNVERKAAAAAEAKKLVADAEKAGLALLQQVRADGAADGKERNRQAEERAAQRAAEISKTVEKEAAALKQEAEKHLEEAAEFIVGRVVKH